MPLYEYVCNECGDRMEVLRTMTKSDEAVTCLSCSAPARRVLSVFASRTKAGAGTGMASPGDFPNFPTPSMPSGGFGGCGAGAGGCACH